MALGAQQQQTFTLVLKAQDDASAAIQAVGKELQRLGEGSAVTGLSAQLGGIGQAAEGALGPLGRFAEFGKQLLIWNVAYAAVNKVTEAISSFGSGLVSTNASLEQFGQTFSAVYQSSAKGQQAVGWLTDFAAKVPATREQVIQAGLALASMGDNIGEVLPRLSNVAAVMGVSLPMAAQALNDAMTGDTQMLRQDLHIQIADLERYGAKVEANGHIVEGTLLPAFEKLADARYAQGAALQMQTFSGKMSNVADAASKLQEIMGRPIFDLLKKQLDGLIAFLGREDVQRWALAVGDAIGHMLSAAMRAAQWMVSTFGPGVATAIALVSAAWQKAQPLVQGAIAALNAAAQQMGAFLHDTVLPAVYETLGAASRWWNQHAAAVLAVLRVIIGAARTAWVNLGTDMKAAVNVLHGVFQVSWGLLTGVVGAALDVMRGDWRRLGNDLDRMATDIAVGIVDIFKGMTEKAIELIAGLADPINKIEHALYDATKPFADELYGMLVLFEVWVEKAYNKVVGILDKIPGIKKILHPVELPTAAEIRAGQKGFEDTFTLGFRPGVDLHMVDTKTAIKNADDWYDAWVKELRGKANLFTGEVQPYDTSVKDRGTGKDIWGSWMKQLDALRKAGITLPPLPGAGPGGGVPDLTQAGFSTQAGAAGGQKKTLDAAVSDAQQRFTLLLDSGKATWSTGIAAIGAILRAEKAAGATPLQMQLDALHDTKHLVSQLVEVARKHFDFDLGVAHPSRKKLEQDEAAVLAILQKTPGISATDLGLARQQMDKAVAGALHSGAAAGQTPASPAPTTSTYGGLAAGYGQTTVSFGGAQQSGWAAVVAELRAMVAYWQRRALADEKQLGYAQSTALNTGQMVQQIGRIVQHDLPPVHAAGSTALSGAMRAGGGFQVLRRV